MRPRELSVAAVALLVLTACGPIAQQEPASSSSQSLAALRFGAPPITRPRDLGILDSHPCNSLFSKSQLTALDYEPNFSQRTTIIGLEECTWQGRSPEKSLSVSISPSRDLFVGAYRARTFAVMIPLQVAGLPALSEKTAPDATICTTTVGVADGQALEFTTVIDELAGPDPIIDPCELGGHAAAEAISNLPVV